MSNKTGKTGKAKINKAVTVSRKRVDPPGTRYRCVCCGNDYPAQLRYFQVSYSPLFEGNNGFLPYCKLCVDSYYQQLVGFYSGNEKVALEHCCRLFDWYYSETAVGMIEDIPKTKAKINAYHTKMGLTNVKRKGETFLDTLRDRADEKRIMKVEDVKETEENKSVAEGNESKTSHETIMFFGLGYTDDEYEFLSKQYEDWITRYECQTKAQEELFKSLCVSQMIIQRATLHGSNKEVAEAMKTFQDLLGTANLKPNQNRDNAFVDQNTFGTLIKKIENERPIGEADEEWKDVDGIKKYIDTFFLGHMCNLVHLKNDWSDQYLEEMAKYTVNPPKYESEEGAEESSLLDKFSDKGDKNESN